MLKAIDQNIPSVNIAEARFPSPFRSGLEYNAPARGTWNIVHTGMLIPEAHQIFVCARGCLRGVILTAAEMNAMDRMSWVSVSENDLYDGTMEQDVIDGVTEILNRIEKRPPCVLLFLSCVHLFAGCDFKMIIERLGEIFPDVHFTDCYMTPTMRKTVTPDCLMRKQLYEPLKAVKKDTKTAAVIGCDRPTDKASELVGLISTAGFKLTDITECKTYGEYLDIAKSSLNITYIPAAKSAGDELEKRFGTKHLYIPLSYGYEEITDCCKRLCGALEIDTPDFSENIAKAEKSLKNALGIIGDTPIAVDYTATPRPLGLCRLLSEHGFNVKRCYADVFIDEEQNDFEVLARKFPDLEIFPTVNVKMRFAADCVQKEKYLAIGQKAAYFCGTDNFVNIVAGGGLYGFEGISKIAELMTDAFYEPKDRRTVIQYKGLGCESCL